MSFSAPSPPNPTSPSLGYGQVPDMLSLSSDPTVNCILGDIPFFTTGIFGFALITFFLILKRANKFVVLIVVSVLIDFLAALLDLTQLLDRGYNNVLSGKGISQVYSLIVAREVGFSLAPGFLYLFYWFYAALPPRGELERPYGGRPFSRILGIINYDDAYHSARWDRWGYIGTLLRVLVLLAITSIPVLQATWRLTAFTVLFNPVYNASAAVAIILASLFVLKILGNVWLSPVTPRHRTIRDYLPILTCLIIDLTVSALNISIFKFSETPLGRFLLAIEFYLIMLYVLSATFYNQVREDTPTSLPQRASSLIGINVESPGGTFNPKPIDTSVAQNDRPSSTRPSLLNRASRTALNRFSSWISRSSNRQETTPRAVEEGDSVYIVADDKKDPQLFDSYYENFGIPDELEPGAGKDAVPGVTANVSASQSKIGLAIGDYDLASSTPEDEPLPNADRSSEVLGNPSKRASATASPVYGLNGIMTQQQLQRSTVTSSRSSDMSSLMRQQAELDKSVAGLQLYSDARGPPSETVRAALGPSPTQSDFSLSRFPEPPFALGGNARFSQISGVDSVIGNEFVVDNMQFTLVPPSIPTIATAGRLGPNHNRQGSFPVSSGGSEVGSIIVANRGRVANSNGTQYDVTSFIDGLTIPPGIPKSNQTAAPTVNGISSAEETGDLRTKPLRVQTARNPTLVPITGAALERPTFTTLISRSGSQTIRSTEPRRFPPPTRRPMISAPVARLSIDQLTAYERPRRAPVTQPGP